MITRDNIKEVLNNLTKKEIQREEDRPGEYFIINLHIFNTGSFTTIESVIFDQEASQEASDTGNLFISKDDFFMILEETTGRTF